MIHRFIAVASPFALVLAACTEPVQESSTQSSQALATPDTGAPRPPPGHRPPPGKHPHGPPPPEAFTACDGKAADDACTVTFGDHTIDGTCRTPPPYSGETRLACAPAHPPPHP